MDLTGLGLQEASVADMVRLTPKKNRRRVKQDRYQYSVSRAGGSVGTAPHAMSPGVGREIYDKKANPRYKAYREADLLNRRRWAK